MSSEPAQTNEAKPDEPQTDQTQPDEPETDQTRADETRADETRADDTQPEPAPLLELRDPLPGVVETDEALAATCAALLAGSGPVAIDAERASGYRYSSRAYLIQLRREGSGSHLVDPIAFESLEPLVQALDGTEWILHAATQDLPCLTELGLYPAELFDTELAGRLLGYPRVGLATLVETRLGYRMKKEHSAADWSTRPLPAPWLQYAALDVEVLLELRDDMVRELEAAGKMDWAQQEFDALRTFQQPPRAEGWRRTSGLHKVRGRRGLGAVRELWEARDEIARTRDIAPGRILPDSAIVAAAQAMPTSRGALLGTKGFHGRGAQRHSREWIEALDRARAMSEDELPARAPRSDAPPQIRQWPERDPVAAARLTHAREGLAQLSERVEVPVENLLTPDVVRRLLWQPPAPRDPDELAEAVTAWLTGHGARPWQIELTRPLFVDAIIAAESETQPEAGAASDS